MGGGESFSVELVSTLKATPIDEFLKEEFLSRIKESRSISLESLENSLDVSTNLLRTLNNPKILSKNPKEPIGEKEKWIHMKKKSKTK